MHGMLQHLYIRSLLLALGLAFIALTLATASA
jgi:hypothetical protein